MEGWFHGCGMFWRADGMKYEGQFRGGRTWGLGNNNITNILSYCVYNIFSIFRGAGDFSPLYIYIFLIL